MQVEVSYMAETDEALSTVYVDAVRGQHPLETAIRHFSDSMRVWAGRIVVARLWDAKLQEYVKLQAECRPDT